MSRAAAPPATPDPELVAAVELLLRPLARLFLEQGLVFATIEELLKAALVRVASEEFSLRGEPPTDSRISVLSGVHRKDVRRLREGAARTAPHPIALPFASEVVTRWVSDILACAPLSVRAIKQMVRAGARLTAAEAQMLRLPALVEALKSSDQDEGVRAFQEKRAPQWRGK